MDCFGSRHWLKDPSAVGAACDQVRPAGCMSLQVMPLETRSLSSGGDGLGTTPQRISSISGVSRGLEALRSYGDNPPEPSSSMPLRPRRDGWNCVQSVLSHWLSQSGHLLLPLLPSGIRIHPESRKTEVASQLRQFTPLASMCLFIFDPPLRESQKDIVPGSLPYFSHILDPSPNSLNDQTVAELVQGLK